ncbi:DUF4834 domain-containing protein [Pedobacter sp. MC2016-24]|uniref:DUF4834 domain-containing protein n=1 Tax=Pedobacter sp. MC2016-24 TaxID=2780090 RepID=UPI0018825CF7|nr:DUF4834 domain-containing protein [Pedobacter sp. MC2016-24]MBE9600366.1 DUF4834 domain-containing protein [Pedobacter sp. MC2016-24]
MGALVKFLLITVLILYAIRLLFRWLFPVVLAKMVNKVQDQANEQARQRNPKPEGSISIDYVPPQPKHGNADKLGDFVDYEEVK